MEESPKAILPGIEHIVVVMLENRSFDTTLGWCYEGSAPRQFIPHAPGLHFEGLTDWMLPDLHYPLTLPGQPTRLYPLKKGATTNVEDNATYLDSPPTDPHEELQYVTDQIYGPLQWSGNPPAPPINPPPGAQPRMKGFLQNYLSALPSSQQGNLPLILKITETYTAAQLPVLNGLAKLFACSDMWFSSAPTQTNPNRAFFACGTSMGQINNEGTWAYGNFDAKTIWNRLHELNVSWKIFWEEVFVPVKDSDNQGWTRKAFPQLRAISSDADFPNMAEFHRRARTGTLPAFSFIEPSWTLEAREIGQTNGIQGDDYHPPGDVRPGEDLLAQIFTSLLANWTAFTKTLLVITFDEHGGTIDHIPPPRAVKPDGHDQEGFDFERYGVRVPAIFVSPLITNGTVIRAGLPGSWPPFDHTSVAATVLSWKGQTRPQYGLRDRTKQAPTFERVLDRPAPRAPEEMILGERRAPSAQTPVKLGDRFVLRYVSAGPYYNWFVGPSTYSNIFGAYYPTSVNNPGQAVPMRFTLGAGALPAQILTHGSFVYIAGTESQVQQTPYWAVQSTGDYERTDVFYAGDTLPTVPNPAVYWTLKHADPALAAVGQEIHFGDKIYLENRYIPSTGDWLPGRLIPTQSDSGYYYCCLTDDPDYSNPAVGAWEIIRFGE